MANTDDKFFVVTDKETVNARYLNEVGTRIKVLSSDRQTLEYIVGIGKDDKDPRKVVRIFSVSEFGKVTFHEVVFNGKLELKEKPNIVEKMLEEAELPYGTV